MSRRPMLALAALVVSLLAIGTAAAQGQEPQAGVCAAAVQADARLQAVIGHLSALASAGSSLWDGYRPETSNYIFVVRGPLNVPCAALWRAGSVSAVFQLSAEPELSTPLYGFLFPDDAAQKEILNSFRQPDALRLQLQELGIRHAIMLPMDGDTRLKLTLSSQELFDMAVHEGFHAYAQFPTWAQFESPHRWPVWTTPQPNRAALATRCYGSEDPLEPRLTAERDALLRAAMSAVTGGSLDSVCKDARLFVAERQSRWLQQASITVPAEQGNQQMSCAQAEAVMEFNEGVADFVSWLTAREIGVVKDEALRRRFNARLRDLAYVTASMQLVVLRRLLGESFAGSTTRMSTSTAWDSGSIFSTLKAQLDERCR